MGTRFGLDEKPGFKMLRPGFQRSSYSPGRPRRKERVQNPHRKMRLPALLSVA